MLGIGSGAWEPAGVTSPGGLFDSHLHVIDPRFPLVSNRGYRPDPFKVEDYRAAAPAGVVGGAVVSGSFQGFDQSYLVAALHQLGPGFAGVTQLPADVEAHRLSELHASGVRAVRVNLFRGGSEALQNLEELAHRVHEVVGWHTELYVDSRDLVELEPRLRALPRISIDHLGLSRVGFPALLRLAERGARVKATGFGRTDLDLSRALAELDVANPHALMFGTDLPCTRAPRPFREDDVDALVAAVGENHADLVLRANAQSLYRPPS